MTNTTILILDSDDGELVDDVHEYHTYRGKPFTGIIEEYVDGVKIFEGGYFQGLRSGYSISWGREGRLETIEEFYRLRYVGILAWWDKQGNIHRIEKKWSNKCIEKLEIRDGAYHIEQIMDAGQQREWLEKDRQDLERRRPDLKWINHFRPEPISYLFEEAMTRYREGTLFNQSFLYTDPKEWEN